VTFDLCSFVLKPDLNSTSGHSELVGKLLAHLLAGHLFCLEDLFKNNKLLRACTLSLLFVGNKVGSDCGGDHGRDYCRGDGMRGGNGCNNGTKRQKRGLRFMCSLRWWSL